MNNFTTETYMAKREILTFSNKLSDGAGRPEKKFLADMLYGIIASGSVLLTDIADSLQEDTKKINTVDRLSKHLAKPLSQSVMKYPRRAGEIHQSILRLRRIDWCISPARWEFFITELTSFKFFRTPKCMKPTLNGAVGARGVGQ